MNYHFCTITTQSHLYKCYALFESLYQIDSKSCLHVLLTDIDNLSGLDVPLRGVKLYILDDIKGVSYSEEIVNKYLRSSDKLRWSLKSVFLRKILAFEEVQELVYVDNDIAFFGEFYFLFEALKTHNILLTPHNYPRDPLSNQNWLEANFRVGLYNAGFVGANKKSVSSLEWWSKCCLYRCEKNYFRGLFDDQKYLDLMPIIDSSTKVLEHKGCNLAGWNLSICTRGEESNEIKINSNWEVIFIHFNPITITCFVEGKDPFLMPYFNKYKEMLEKFNSDSNLTKEAVEDSLINRLKLMVWNLLDKVN
jgi:hypothetical protein